MLKKKTLILDEDEESVSSPQSSAPTSSSAASSSTPGNGVSNDHGSKASPSTSKAPSPAQSTPKPASSTTPGNKIQPPTLPAKSTPAKETPKKAEQKNADAKQSKPSTSSSSSSSTANKKPPSSPSKPVTKTAPAKEASTKKDPKEGDHSTKRKVESNSSTEKGKEPTLKKPKVEQKKADDDDDLPLTEWVKKKGSETPKKESATPSKSTKKEAEVDEDDLPISELLQKKAAGTPKKPTPEKKSTVTPKKEPATPKKEVATPKTVKKETSKAVKKETPKKTAASPKSTPKGKAKASTTPKKETGKKRKRSEKEEDNEEEEDDGTFKWWKAKEKLPEGQRWRTLEHNGVIFPPPYQPHGVKMLYDGKPVSLTPVQEEIATFYAQQLASQHVKKAQFNKNFFREFKAVLGKDHVIKSFEKCDFSPIHEYLMKQREEKKNWTKEQKQKEKEEKAELQEKYGWALVDGHKQKVGNFRVEPPGLFLGRGEHPKTGCVKKRIMPEDVTINIGKDAAAPKCPIPGHDWKAVVHDNTVTWLAFWKENINDQFKYVWLSASSHLKGQSDFKKFETARRLGANIDKIREVCQKELRSKDLSKQQRATALWLIDKLALRVGNEKGADEADTVGCCSLRVEHIKLTPPKTVDFDFLGKDSMRYQRTVEVDTQVFANLQKFVKGKSPKEDIFDQLTTTALNNHLKKQMAKLTAKVFRTYNASYTLQTELDKMPKDLETVEEKVLYYNRCNANVAILCNHQRSLPKTFSEQMEKLDAQIQEKRDQKKELEAHLKFLKTGKKSAPPKKKQKKGSDDEEEKPKLPDDPDKVKARIKKVDEAIKKLEIKKTEKEDLKTVALGTSKINYLDPRITAAWCTKWGVPIAKIFSKTLREKFPWALEVPANWTFNSPPEGEADDDDDSDDE